LKADLINLVDQLKILKSKHQAVVAQSKILKFKHQAVEQENTSLKVNLAGLVDQFQNQVLLSVTEALSQHSHNTVQNNDNDNITSLNADNNSKRLEKEL